MSKFELSLSKNYVNDWGLTDAIREILQNAIDQSVVVPENKMNIEYKDNILKISNKKSVLDKKHLLLGVTSKADDKKTIGQFGEGLKVALLVLNRIGKKVTIFNYGKKEVWNSRFVKSKRYENEEILTIFVDKKYIWEKVPNENLTIEVDINENEWEEIKSKTLILKDVKEKIETDRGVILLDENEKGNVYSNGLFVCNNESLKYGYNMKPEHLCLGRDRNVVSGFNLQWEASMIWRKSDRADMIYDLLDKNVADVQYLMGYSLSNTIVDSISEDFVRNYGECSYPVSSEEERIFVEKNYKCTPVITNKLLASAVLSNNSFKEKFELKNSSEYGKIEILVNNWKQEYGKDLSKVALNELNVILNTALGEKVFETYDDSF